MKRLTEEIVRFFQKQHFVIVSTIDRNNKPHCSCKGIIEIDNKGRIYLLDLYRWRTFANLKRNPYLSITAVDEHRFRGWSLKGKAKIVSGAHLERDVIKAWEKRLATRIAHRLLKNIQQDEKGHNRHPEAQLPKPEYMIEMDVEEIVDLIPHHVK